MRTSPYVSTKGDAASAPGSASRSRTSSPYHGMPCTGRLSTTSPISVRPEFRRFSRKPLITLTTMMTSAVHSATAATAMSGMMRVVR